MLYFDLADDFTQQMLFDHSTTAYITLDDSHRFLGVLASFLYLQTRIQCLLKSLRNRIAFAGQLSRLAYLAPSSRYHRLPPSMHCIPRHPPANQATRKRHSKSSLVLNSPTTNGHSAKSSKRSSRFREHLTRTSLMS